ncbi:MAG: NADH-quinone oxidoreductase subunit C [Chloroflexi bacterium]|nr:NADH-quinone oxidoreductase subunit C [Chloroflexota bacterium]
MTQPLTGEVLARRIKEVLGGVVDDANATDVWVRPQSVLEVCRFLKETPDLGFDFLNSISGVDYVEYFEVVYHLTSLVYNHSTVVKTRVYGREEPTVPSVLPVWRGADLQEREVYDLMGIVFAGHPNLKRIMLWEGFPGHPLRRDWSEPDYPYTWPHGG